MAKRKEKSPPDKDTVLKLVDLQCAVIQHCSALKATTEFLSSGKKEAAIGRLDSAVTALLAVVRGQCAGMKMACPKCGTEQNVVAWVDDKECSNCGGPLEVLGMDS
jgi:hypothetical protein